jgi:hypothetical protein
MTSLQKPCDHDDGDAFSDYYREYTCETPGCTVCESFCRDCHRFVRSCECGIYCGADGWQLPRRRAWLKADFGKISLKVFPAQPEGGYWG